MVEKRTVDKFFSAAGNEYGSKKDALAADIITSLEDQALANGDAIDRPSQLLLRCIIDDAFWTAFKANRDRLRAEYDVL